MADQQQPGSVFDYIRGGAWRQQPGTQTPGGTASAPPTAATQPYDPVTGLPTSTTPAGAPPVASTPTGPTYETRSGAGHFGGGDAGAANGLAGAIGGSPTGTTPTQQGPQNYLEDAYKQLGGAYLAPTYASASMGGLQSQLAQPGQAEQFYQQAQNTSTDPYYQRLQQQGNDTLNQQMAARGNYNSGGALAALGNFNSGLAAQQYHQMGDLANQAQSQGQARVGLSGQLANTADQGDLSRLNSMFGVAGQAQGANQSGINSMLAQQMGIDNMGSGLVGGFYGQGGQLSGNATTDSINAMIQAGQAQAQGQQAQQGQIMSMLPFALG